MMKVLVIFVFWGVVFGDSGFTAAVPMKDHELHTDLLQTNISVRTFLEGMKTTRNIYEYIEKILLDLKQYDSVDTESKESCESMQESFVQGTLQKLPIDGVLRRIAEIALYMGKGCTRRAFETGNQFFEMKINLDTLKNCRNYDNDQCFIENEIRLSELLHQSLSVGLMYDVIAAAVYGPEHHIKTAENHVNKIIKEVFGRMVVEEFPFGKSFSRVRRDVCSDEDEVYAYEKVSRIPIIGALYGVVSSTVYGSNECVDVVADRLLNSYIDLLTLGFSALLGIGRRKRSVNQVFQPQVEGEVKETVGTVKSFFQIPELILEGEKRGYKPVENNVGTDMDAGYFNVNNQQDVKTLSDTRGPVYKGLLFYKTNKEVNNYEKNTEKDLDRDLTEIQRNELDDAMLQPINNTFSNRIHFSKASKEETKNIL